MITEKPKMWKSSDGKEFATEAAAERWEEVQVAFEKYESARDAFWNRIADTNRTADGFLFKRMEEYYWIRKPAYGRPWIHTISGYEYRFELADWHGEPVEEAVLVVPLKDSDGAEKRQWIKVPIAEMYRCRWNADKAWMADMSQYIEDEKRHLAQIEEMFQWRGH